MIRKHNGKHSTVRIAYLLLYRVQVFINNLISEDDSSADCDSASSTTAGDNKGNRSWYVFLHLSRKTTS